MILFFSGTGNSAFVARKLARKIQDEYMNVFEMCIRDRIEGALHKKCREIPYAENILAINGVGKNILAGIWSYVKKKYKLNVTNFLYF